MESFLTQVFLPAIQGHVPDRMVQAIASFLEFCYLVRRSIIDEDALVAIDNAVRNFHRYREIFRELGVRDDFNLPRQHSMTHYHDLIQEFGAPNGLCSSITESKHIKAVKEPYRRSSRFNEIGQMILTNQRLDKLAASRVDFVARGMMARDIVTTPLPVLQPDDEEEEGAIDAASYVGEVRLSKRPGKCLYCISTFANYLTYIFM